MKLRDMCQMYGYVEITEGKKGNSGWGEPMSSLYRNLQTKTFKIVEIDSDEDIWPEFKKLFGSV